MKEFCIHDVSKCIDSRKCEGYVRRRRECTQCGYRFTTVEVPVEFDGPRVGKKKGKTAWDLLRKQLFTDEQRRVIAEIGLLLK